MCTLVVSYRPDARIPLLLAAVRDEFIDRAWDPPAAYWPDQPDLIGGRDRQAGGTWLAVAPEHRRAACVLNGRGTPAAPTGRRSRGELPLYAAATGRVDVPAPATYDPFHLVRAGADGLVLASWDGAVRSGHTIGPGVHIVVNTGLDPAEPRAARFIPRFAAAPRPDPEPGDDPAAAWQAWLPLVEGDGLAPDDPAALIVRRDAGDGRAYGSTSVSLLAIGPRGVRYDFCAAPERPAWWTVLDG